MELVKVFADTSKRVIVGLQSETKIDYIQKSICEFFKITLDDLKSRSRKKELVTPRQIGIYLSKNLTTLSLNAIGLYFGGRDHSTVIHSIETVKYRMVIDKKYKTQMLKIQKRMKLKTTFQ